MVLLKASKVQFGLTLLEVALAASFFSVNPASASDWSAYGVLDSLSRSDSMAITQLDKGSGRYYNGGKQAFTSNWLEVGARYQQWSLGALYRYEQNYRYSSDFADFYYAISQENALPVGRNYQLKLHAETWRATGLRAAYEWDLQNHRLQLGASLFNADNLSYGDIVGNASANSDKTYQYQANVNYRYEQDQLFGRTDRLDGNGRGYSLDFRLSGKFNWGGSYDLWVRDALGEINWGNTLQTTVKGSSVRNCSLFDGCPQNTGSEYGGNSPLSGNAFTQSLSPWVKAQFNAPLSERWSGILAYQEHYGYGMTGIGIATNLLFKQTSVIYYPTQALINLGVEQGHWRWGIASDAIDVNEARSFWLTLSYR